MFKKIICSLVFIFGINLSAFGGEHYFKFQIDDREELENITRVISIDNVDGLTVYAYAGDDQLTAFKALGYDFEILPHPGTLIKPRMAATATEATDWDVYPSYDTYVSMMYQFATDYPDLCQVVNVGYSVVGREILFARISDNVAVEEDEPEVMYTSTMHGDETVGYVLMLRLIDSVLTAYGSDPRITDMVDNMEIWINPLANPDGTYNGGDLMVSGAIRYNANGVDLNRNFPDPDDGDHPDNKTWQPETLTMMSMAENHSFVLSANFHGGVEVVNFPWDTWYIRHADDSWFQNLSRQYADTAHANSYTGYMDYLDNGITNGYDWYPISGGRQDYMTYWFGCRETTIELSDIKLVSESLLPNYWLYNRASLLNYLERARYGIRGVVTDYITGLPVAATVKVLDHDADSSEVYTDPDVGDYHRMLLAGVYDMQFIAESYITQTVTGITLASDTSTVVLDIQLVHDSEDIDGDGVLNNADNCLTVYNPLQEDNDGDSIGNACDNCVDVYNPEQQDSDGDDEGDACECCQGIVGNVNCDETNNVDISDITRLIDHLYLTREALCCLEEANANGDSELVIDISDITALIDYLYLSHSPLSDCF